MINNRDDYGAREAPLINAALYGQRAFKVRDDGTLHPLHRNTDDSYTSGVNVATCDVVPMNFTINFNGALYEFKQTMEDMFHPGKKTPDMSCTCGFYAYFDDSPDTAFLRHWENDCVNGIVRASGKCVVGDKGFRAEKMEIVALVANAPGKTRPIRTRINNMLYELSSGIGKLWPGYMYFLAVHWVVMMLNFFVFEDNPVIEFAYSSTSVILYSVAIVAFMSAIYSAFRLKNMDVIGLYDKPSEVLTEKMLKAYPDIPIYDSLKEAKKAFPITKASELPQ